MKRCHVPFQQLLLSLKIAAMYALSVFSIGFVLGTLRVLVLTPKLGEGPSVLIELPLMIMVSWIICQRLNKRNEAQQFYFYLVMSISSFIILMTLEFIISMTFFKMPPLEYLQSFRSLLKVLGLLAQVAFASFPIVYYYSSKKIQSNKVR